MGVGCSLLPKPLVSALGETAASSTNAPNSPQSGHLPNHLGAR
jgi:hypothetical protein